MKKTAKKKSAVRKASTPVKKRAAAKPALVAARKAAAPAKKKTSSAVPQKATGALDGGGKLSFNHAMIYVKDVQRGLEFYRQWLGFKVIEDFRHEGKSV